MASSEYSQSEDQVRVVLWAPPRSLSTAFERCISTLYKKHSIHIYHEPFTTAFHLGPERQTMRRQGLLYKLVATDPKYSYKWVKEQLEAPFEGKQVVFFKDLGYSLDGHFEYLPEGYKHTFLIRSPKLVLTSMNNLLLKYPTKVFGLKLGDILPKGWVYKEMYYLYKHLTDTLGLDVTVIDAEDLIERPEEMLALYCETTGIPYEEGMITWRPCTEDMHDWKYSKRLMKLNRIVGQYDRALSSDALGKPSPRVIDISKYPDDCQEAITVSEPYYQKLYEERLRLPTLHGTVK